MTGASSGIGVELARVLAHRGHGVTLVARRESRLRELAQELDALGVRVEVIPCDLADPASRCALVGELAGRQLTVDVLLNNAGLTTQGPVANCDPASEVAQIRVDVEAVVDLCSRFVPEMVRRGRGAVLNVSSVGAFQPIPGQAAYAGAKAFILSYTRALAAEVRGTGVSVGALCPGPVRTELIERAGWTEEETAGVMPEIMWVPAAEVARAGIEGLDRGRGVIIPGMANRLAACASYLTPRRLLMPFLVKHHPSMRTSRSKV